VGSKGKGSAGTVEPALAERPPLRVLFVCTGNSARSILGEVLLRYRGGDAVAAYSAGTAPKGLNPLTLRVLAEAGLSVDGLASKSVASVLDQPYDWVITVCDDARDTCPVIPGGHKTAHWSLSDPAAVDGTEDERLAAFRTTLATVDRRVRSFLREERISSNGDAMTALHLLRHAHAGDPAKYRGDDAQRPLSDRGRRQASALAKLLVALPKGEAPDLFITSPRVRSVQTAEIVAKALGVPVVSDERLAAALDLDVVADILASAGPAERPCIVGHDPDFSELLGALLGTRPVPMRKGAFARIDIAGPRLDIGRGTLRFLLPPELVQGAG
jgi:arsenate reductase